MIRDNNIYSKDLLFFYIHNKNIVFSMDCNSTHFKYRTVYRLISIFSF